MGYFSNGMEGANYQYNVCNHCIHGSEGGEGMHDCPVLELHEEHNYEECNKPDSFLHVLIPRNEEGFNDECTMFIRKPEKETPPHA